jgi:hypothetical protein
MKLRHFAIILLGLWCLINAYGALGVTNWYEQLLAYLTVMVPFALGLLFLSNSSKKKDMGWQRIIAIVGLYVSVITLVLPVLVLARDLMTYYQQS